MAVFEPGRRGPCPIKDSVGSRGSWVEGVEGVEGVLELPGLCIEYIED